MTYFQRIFRHFRPFFNTSENSVNACRNCLFTPSISNASSSPIIRLTVASVQFTIERFSSNCGISNDAWAGCFSFSIMSRGRSSRFINKNQPRHWWVPPGIFRLSGHARRESDMHLTRIWWWTNEMPRKRMKKFFEMKLFILEVQIEFFEIDCLFISSTWLHE